MDVASSSSAANSSLLLVVLLARAGLLGVLFADLALIASHLALSLLGLELVASLP